MSQPSTDQSANAPSVFISYAHEGDLPQQTKALADYLRSHGFEVITDHEYLDLPPDDGWPTWMQNSVRDSDVVLLVGSEKYKARFEKKDRDPDSGLGVTWEAGLITTEIYENKLTNNRVIPILPDGFSTNFVPDVLKPWFNGCNFPSENQKIVRATKESLRRQKKTEKLAYLGSFSQPVVADNSEQAETNRQEITAETIFDTNNQRSATYGINNRQLTGPADPLLQPEREVFLGREKEVAEVLEFLRSASSSAHILSRHLVGTAGIGKTEVCKAALKTWLHQDKPSMDVWWVQVPDESTPEDFLKQLAKMLGMPDDAVNRISTAEELVMLPGLYYLDNLESIADSDKGRKILKTLNRFQGVRILASSRVSLDGVLGSEIKIDPLDEQSAMELFSTLYNGIDNPDEEAVSSFVEKELGRHALSIRLVAVSGKYYPSFDTLKAAWQDQGTAISKSRKVTGKEDSLDISFSLTMSLLAKVEGALDLWQFFALFNRSIPDETLRLWEQASGHTQAFFTLCDHNICSITEDGIFMLPPVARFALSKDNLHAAEINIAFNWQRAANHAMNYFLALSKFGDVFTSDPIAAASRVLCAQQFSTANQLIQIATETNTLSIDAILLFHNQCINIYQYNPVESLALLNTLSGIKSTSSIFREMANMERFLGELGKSREHYEQAISLAKSDDEDMNLANAHQDIAELELRLKEYDSCREHLNQATEIYEKLNDELGQANCLLTLGSVEFELGNFDHSHVHYKKAKDLYKSVSNDMGLAGVYFQLGQLEIQQENWQVSYDYLQQSLQLNQSINFDLGQANSIRDIGYWHFNQGQYQEALKNYQTAISLYQKVQEPMGLAYCFSLSLTCQKELGLSEEIQLKALAAQALDAAYASNAPHPIKYAKDTIADCFGFDLDTEKDKAAFDALLQELESVQVDIYSS